jgi:hypothetical protein
MPNTNTGQEKKGTLLKMQRPTPIKLIGQNKNKDSSQRTTNPRTKGLKQ